MILKLYFCSSVYPMWEYSVQPLAYSTIRKWQNTERYKYNFLTQQRKLEEH